MTRKVLIADPLYNPNFQSKITSATKLGRGVTIAKFLGAYGDPTSFNFVSKASDRLKIARNLYLQAEAINVIVGNPLFSDIRLIVSEGLYQGGPDELVTNPNDKKADGRLVYYQVINKRGRIDFEKTFDVAEYWKDHIDFDKLSLDYDTYNRDESLTAQIGLEMPEATSDFNMFYLNDLETMFNGTKQSGGELVEIKEKADD